MFYTSLVVTTAQIPITDVQKVKRKKSKHNTTESHQITKEEIQRRKAQRNYKTVRK